MYFGSRSDQSETVIMDGEGLQETCPLEIKVGDLFIDTAFNVCIYVQRIYIEKEQSPFDPMFYEYLVCLVSGKGKTEQKNLRRPDFHAKLKARPKSFKYVGRK